MFRNIAAWIIVIAYVILTTIDLWNHRWQTGLIGACYATANYLIFLMR